MRDYFGSECQSKVLNSTIFKNSAILTQEQSLILIQNITTLFPNDTVYSLIYQATRNGFSISDFHSKCDGIEYTLTIIRTTNSYVFGGFTSRDWSSQQGQFESDSNAFLFSLVNPFNNLPIKMNIDLPDFAIRSDESLITFGYEIILNDNSNREISFGWPSSVNSFKLASFLNGTGSLLIGGSTGFYSSEIEVYSLNLNRNFIFFLSSSLSCKFFILF